MIMKNFTTFKQGVVIFVDLITLISEIYKRV